MRVEGRGLRVEGGPCPRRTRPGVSPRPHLGVGQGFVFEFVNLELLNLELCLHVLGLGSGFGVWRLMFSHRGFRIAFSSRTRTAGMAFRFWELRMTGFIAESPYVAGFGFGVVGFGVSVCRVTKVEVLVPLWETRLVDHLIRGSWVECTRFGVLGLGLGFRISSSDFRVQGLGFRVENTGLRAHSLGLGIWGSGFVVEG